MAALGALAHWRLLPFPIRIGAGLLGFLLVTWLSRSLGGTSIVIAAALWLGALAGLLYGGGGLRWLDRYPAVTRVLDSYAPRLGRTMAPAPPGTPTPAGSGSPAEPARTSTVLPIPDVTRFVGIDDIRTAVEGLVASRAASTGTVAPATIVLLLGPRGTGKSSVALALASRLHNAGALRSDRIVMISPAELPGFSDSYGASAETLQAVANYAQASLDGVLLIEDLDWLTSAPGGQAASEVGIRLLDLARRYPGRLFVVGSGSAEALARLDPGRRWLGQFNVRRIEFTNLTTDALHEIFVQLLRLKGLSLAPDADRALEIKLREMMRESADAFDNAHAIRRLVDAILAKMPRDASGGVTGRDIRDADPSL